MQDNSVKVITKDTFLIGWSRRNWRQCKPPASKLHGFCNACNHEDY